MLSPRIPGLYKTVVSSALSGRGWPAEPAPYWIRGPGEGASRRPGGDNRHNTHHPSKEGIGKKFLSSGRRPDRERVLLGMQVLKRRPRREYIPARKQETI